METPLSVDRRMVRKRASPAGPRLEMEPTRVTEMVVGTAVEFVVFEMAISNCVFLSNEGSSLPGPKLPFLTLTVSHRYYAQSPSHAYPPQVHDYNSRFTKTLETIKHRHDPTVTTVAQGVLEWQKAKGIKSGMGVGLPAYGHSGGEVQAWLDRFYMSRIGIRFLIGQREWFILCVLFILLTRGKMSR